MFRQSLNENYSDRQGKYFAFDNSNNTLSVCVFYVDIFFPYFLCINMQNYSEGSDPEYNGSIIL